MFYRYAAKRPSGERYRSTVLFAETYSTSPACQPIHQRRTLHPDE